MPPIKESKLRAMIRTELKKRLLQEQDDASIEGQQLQKLKQLANQIGAREPQKLIAALKKDRRNTAQNALVADFFIKLMDNGQNVDLTKLKQALAAAPDEETEA